MRKDKRIFFTAVVMTLILSLTACGRTPGTVSGDVSGDAVSSENQTGDLPVSDPSDTVPSETSLAASELRGVQRAVIRSFDWGPGVVKTVLSLNHSVAAGSVTARGFAVSETKAFFDPNADGGQSPVDAPPTTITTARRVLDAYPCDRMGNRLEQDSPFVAVELACDPERGSPYCFDPVSGHNVLCDPYRLTVELTPESVLSDSDGSPVTDLTVDRNVNLSLAYLPDLNGVERDFTYTGWDGRMLYYAFYEPPQDEQSHPLIIWLHGETEGGENTVIPLLANRVSALWGEEFQTLMGGAFIVVPQVPDFWTVCNDAGERGNASGASSVYGSTLISLIQSYVATTPGIDSDRIYIGGCSEGGYMALDMIFHYPRYFAAVIPVCESFPDAAISASRLESVRKLPMWFVYAENDTVVPPEFYSASTAARLREIGTDVHMSAFPGVSDLSGLYRNADGSAYEYDGHQAWIYFFTNACEDADTRIWEWLARQKK